MARKPHFWIPSGNLKITVSTNVFLRRIQNFALDMGWLPWPILKRKQFPKVKFRPKRGITSQGSDHSFVHFCAGASFIGVIGVRP